jgi:hypothetical protein
VIVRQELAGLDGEVTDAFKRLVGNVGQKVGGELGRLEFGLKVAAYGSVAAAALALLAAWGSWRRR